MNEVPSAANLKAVIIDDEPDSRQLISKLLSHYCESVQLVGLAASARQGIELIRQEQPQVVFLDIEMPEDNGFEVLNAFPDPYFKVIIITGHDEYAVKAIKYSALDYLLKPIQIGELQQAVESVKRTLDQHRQLDLFRELYKKEQRIGRIALPGTKQYEVVLFDNILKICSEENYVTFYMKSGQELLASHHLQFYNDLLPSELFFRINRSCMVHLHHVISYDKGKGGMLTLSDGSREPISYRRKAAFLQTMNFLNKSSQPN